MRVFIYTIPLSLLLACACLGQSSPAPATAGDPLVQKALAAELAAAQDSSHPMRYRLRKSSPRLTSTKEIFETRDGAVAMLLAIDDEPPSPADAQKEKARLDALLADATRQQRRKQNQQEDTERALKVLRALPKAFIYQYAGSAPNGTSTGNIEKFTFTPNPKFNPPDLETEVLSALTGEIWIDPAAVRVVRLEGHLQQDEDFGWGILGRLNKGGWIAIDQADVGNGVWRVVRFTMQMSGRVLIKTRSFDTTEEESDFMPVPPEMDYRKAIEKMRSEQSDAKK